MKKIFRHIVSKLGILMLIASCASGTIVQNKEDLTILSARDAFMQTLMQEYPFASSAVISSYINMSDEHRVSQLIITALRFDKGYYQTEQSLLTTLKTLQPGGIILFKDNIQSLPQVKSLITEIQKTMKIPAFISTDVEGRGVNRFEAISSSLGSLPSAEEITQNSNAATLQNLMFRTGKELYSLGINMNFAPVADIRSKTTPPFLQKRIYGNSPEETAAFVSAAVQGLKASRVIPVVKHFPGHGSASADTHKETAIVRLSLSTIQSRDLLPFRRAIEKKIDAVMMGHLYVPAIDPDAPVVELSVSAVRLLREDMNFQGLIITDSLNMNAVKTSQTNGFEVRAVNSGINVLLDSPNSLETKAVLVRALQDGSLSRKAVAESVIRILHIKELYGIL